MSRKKSVTPELAAAIGLPPVYRKQFESASDGGIAVRCGALRNVMTETTREKYCNSDI